MSSVGSASLLSSELWFQVIAFLPLEDRLNLSLVDTNLLTRVRDPLHYRCYSRVIKNPTWEKVAEFMKRVLKNKNPPSSEMLPQQAIEYLFSYYPSLYPALSSSQKNNEKTILKALASDPKNFQHLPLKERKKKLFFEPCLERWAWAITHLPSDISEYEQIVKAHLQKHPQTFDYLDPWVKSNKAITLSAIEADPFQLEYAHYTLQDDEEVVKAAVSRKGITLAYASDRIKAMRGIVFKAVQNDPRALYDADNSLQEDEELLSLSFKGGFFVMEYLCCKIQKIFNRINPFFSPH